MELTPEQRDAVCAGKSVAVTAGAGTGKTRMLADRYLFHLDEQGMSPLEIVAITFTDRAANELRSRIRKTVSDRFPDRPEREDLIAELEAAQISTIHSLCARICRDHPEESGAPYEFEVIDEGTGAIISDEWLFEALDSMPEEIYADIPFSLLREILAALLSDPVMATRALEHGPEQWPQISADAQAQLLDELKGDTEYISAVGILKSFQGQDGDLIEAVRQEALEASLLIDTECDDWKSGLQKLAALKLAGGSQKKWPSGGLNEIRSALKQLKEKAGKALKDVTALKPGPADERFAAMLPSLRKAFAHVRDHIQRSKYGAGLLDYNDLEECALRALQSGSVRHFYTARWRAFLVDEFQDTNQIQAEIIELLTGDGCLTIVGDEKQSIYGFRRADVEVFRRFKFQIENGGGQHQALSLSFRAHVELIDRFNSIFASLLEQLHQPLESGRAESPHDGPHVRVFAGTAERGVSKDDLRRSEAKKIAELIDEMLKSGMMINDGETGRLRPVGPGDIAILSRAWDPLDVYAEALASAGIPAVHMGGGNLLDTREAKDSIMMLRFLADHGDDLALVAVLRSPFFAVSDRALFDIAQKLDHQEPWWEQLKASAIPDLNRPVEVLEKLLSERRISSPGRLLQLANRMTGYGAVIANLPNAVRREADWSGMIDFIRSIERACGDDLFVMVRRLRTYVNGEIEIERPRIEARNAVPLMTIHGAKGLEWPVVIIPDLARNRPNDSKRISFDQHRGVGIRLKDEEGESERTMLHALFQIEQRKRDQAEARRLLYVAITRARDRVILTATEKKGGYLDYLTDGLDAAGIPIEKIEHDPLDALPFEQPSVRYDSTGRRMMTEPVHYAICQSG